MKFPQFRKKENHLLNDLYIKLRKNLPRNMPMTGSLEINTKEVKE